MHVGIVVAIVIVPVMDAFDDNAALVKLLEDFFYALFRS